MDASEIYSKRLNAKEVIFPREKGEIIFPAADGRIKLSGGDQELRTSTLVRYRPIQGESNIDFLGESEESPPSPPQNSYPDASEARNDFWWPGGWGPQGRPKTGGGGLARVPNLRLRKHLCNLGWHMRGEKDELTSCRGTV